MEIVLPHNFTPRRYQRRAMSYFDNGGKRAITVWHRRAGKDLTAMHQTCKMASRWPSAYWHFFPTMEQGRKAIWEGFTKDGQRIMEAVFPGFLEPKRSGSIVKRKHESQMTVELHGGALWRLIGTDKMESVGAGPAGCVFSEFALCRPKAWDLVRPMLRENGGWAWFITTPRGANHAKKLFDSAGPGSGWFRDLRTVRDTGLHYPSNRNPGVLLSPDEMMNEERAEGMEEALVRQEYLCDWTAANVGSVWGDLLEALERDSGIGDFEHERDGTFTVWDLGLGDSTSIWWFRPTGPGTVDVVDFYENHGLPLSHYMDEVEARAQRMGYAYVKHWLPHDARAKTLQTGASVMDQLLGRWGASRLAIVPSLSISDGIQAGRWLLQQDIAFHSRCADGLEALRAYHYAFDDDRKTFSRTPFHDWSSHAADGFRYLACVMRASDAIRPKAEVPKRPDIRPMNKAFTLDELWETRENEYSRGRR